jgi:ferredoxin-like protein FixX
VAAAVSNFRSKWTAHNFRTSLVSSPKVGVSVYLDSCNDSNNDDDSNADNDTADNKQQQQSKLQQQQQQEVALIEGRKYLQICIAKQLHQSHLEKMYIQYIKCIHCFKIFLNLLHKDIF